MRFQGQVKLGFFPLPLYEAVRLRRWLNFPEQFSALDPCAGDGAAFNTLLEPSNALRYGIEIDAHRSAQARAGGIDVLHANTLDVRCSTESVSLMYLNPPYDWEYGQGRNERLELIFLQHTTGGSSAKACLYSSFRNREYNRAHDCWLNIFATYEFIG